MDARRSQVPLAEQLPGLLLERGLSTNRFAGMINVSQSHLWRVVRQADRKTVSGDLAERIAVALGLPSDWFPEARQARVIQFVRADAALCDRLYDELMGSKPSR
jgi:transcriptional regulator with XRE-family HTH domain